MGVCIPWSAAHVSTGRRDRTRWQDHLSYLEGLGSYLERASGTPTIVLGDFNQAIPRFRQPVHVAQSLETKVIDRGLRQVPEELLLGVGRGDYEVFGSIIRATSSGRIVGHLQETSALASIVGHGPLALPGLLGDVVIGVQNEQIKAAISVVQSLQIANLAVGAAAIGVSVAGTALMLRKLSAVQKQLDTIEPQLAAIAGNVRDLRRERIAEDFTRLSTLLAQLDECWSLGQPEAEWRAIARDAHFLADTFRRRAHEVRAESHDPLMSVPFIDAFAMAAMTRVTARLACEDTAAALDAARSNAADLIGLGKTIQLAPIILERARHHTEDMGSPAWARRIDEAEAAIRPSVDLLRQREAASVSTIEIIALIQESGFSGREWLAAAREEDFSPFIFLPTAG